MISFWTLFGVVLGAMGAGIFFLLKRRRRTPRLKLDMDTLPAIEEGLPTISGLTAATVHHGNAATIFQDGAIFDAMEKDIRAARHTVHLESFVWSAGELERRFVELLCNKRQTGVKVRVLLDFMGSHTADDEQLQRMRDAGVELWLYSCLHWWNWRRMNHRTHRKILIVDGQIGYTFGHGIADQWLGHGEDEKHWRDTAVRLEGPVVHALQAVFVENWIEESQCVPSGEGCFPELSKKGDIPAHVVRSACGDELSNVALLYTLAIACARKEVIIQSPYFAPDDGVVDLLAMMIKRGVAVHLMVPGKHTDSPVVRRAGCCLYEGLLRAGVRIYEFQPTLLHQKVIIVDGIWSHIGSTNFDARSLALNEEVGVGLLDAGIAAELRAAYEKDMLRADELSLEEWCKRSWYERTLNWIAYRVSDQL